MSHFCLRLGLGFFVSVFTVACGSASKTPTTPSTSLDTSVGSSGSSQPSPAPTAAQPPFNLEAILRGDGFGLVKFRQAKDPTQNIVELDVWVRDLLPNTSYSLQRATDTAVDGLCTGTNWLTLGQGSAPQPILTDDKGTGRAALWRDLSSVAPGSAFDIDFRILQNGTTTVPLQSDCYRFVVRD
jgi:hypothetical protein